MSAIRMSNYKEDLFEGYRFISPVADIIEPALNAVLGEKSEFDRFVIEAISSFPWVYNMISVPTFFMVKDSVNSRIPSCMPGIKFMLVFVAHINAARLYQMEHTISERSMDAIMKADETLKKKNRDHAETLAKTLTTIQKKYLKGKRTRHSREQMHDLNAWVRAYVQFFNHLCQSDVKPTIMEFYGSSMLRPDNYEYQYRTYTLFKSVTPDLYAVFERNSNPINAKIHGLLDKGTDVKKTEDTTS